MSDKAFLKHLITEDIYVLDVDKSSDENIVETTAAEQKAEVSQKEDEASPPKATTPQLTEVQNNSNPEPVSHINEEKKEEDIKEEKVLAPVYKQILIIVADTTNQKLNLTDKKYIAKILQAVKVDLHSISLINILNEKVENLEGVEKILAFTPNHQLDISLAPYQLSDYQNTKMIVSEALATVAQSVELRKKLWGVLQVMFPNS